MQQLLERPFGGFRICTVFLDGTCYRDQNLLVAMGLTCEGYKIALGLRQVSTENAIVVKELLSDLTRRGLDLSVPRLYVLDGSKGLSAGLRTVAPFFATANPQTVHDLVIHGYADEGSPLGQKVTIERICWFWVRPPTVVDRSVTNAFEDTSSAG
jgi:mutator family transposase